MCRLKMSITLILLIHMQIHTLKLGTLKVRAVEMIKPISQAEIGLTYNIDHDGYIMLSLNGLLLIEGDQFVIFDPGCADFLSARRKMEYGLEILESIESVLYQKGVDTDQVTDVVFTHLHFDHGSGAFKRVPGNIVKRFPGARYHVLKEHYEYAIKPDPSESDSFFTGLFRYLDQIHWLEEWKADWLEYRVFNGHTRGMVVPVIKTGKEELIYLTDLVPMKSFLDQKLYSGYDLDPELALKEKQEFLHSIEKSTKVILFHDPLIDSVYYP
jgi:glyoxylase-like metal-dependent hydrolase (beta-lactamase superfamily II)